MVRPIEAGDLENYRAILEATSPEDRYCRFFHFIDQFDDAELRKYVEPRPDMAGFIAEEGHVRIGAAHGFLIGEARAELGIIVATTQRRRGVGTALMERLVGELRHRGARDLVAYALSENAAFTRLARKIGMTASSHAREGVTEWHLQLGVPSGSAEMAPGAVISASGQKQV